jgi:hypothetical protein
MAQLTLVNLSALLETFYEMSAKTAKSEPPSKELKKGYFELLKDLDFEAVNKNGFDHFRKNRYFPAACDLRGDTDKINEAKADSAYRLVEFLMREFYFEGYGESCMNTIELKLKAWNETDLLPLLKRWGREILEGSNPSATRAQFLKSYLIEHGEYNQLPEHKKREISDRALEILEPMLENAEAE